MTTKPRGITQPSFEVHLTAKDYPYLAAGDGVTDDTTPLTNLFAAGQDIRLDGSTYLSQGGLVPSQGTSIIGQGREKTYLKNSSVSSFNINAVGQQFVTYQDFTLNRSGAVNGRGLSHLATSNAVPLEGFKALRVNCNGHQFGLVIKDFVLASIDECYLQNGQYGFYCDKTGANYNTMLHLKHSWLRGNTLYGAYVGNVFNSLIQNVAFEGSGVHTPTGLYISGGSSHLAQACWFEDLQQAGSFNSCGTVKLDGGFLNGSSLTSAAFYAYGTTVVFDGPWTIQNLSQNFCQADTGATIIIRSPDLAGVGVSAVNGGRVIWDLPTRNLTSPVYGTTTTIDCKTGKYQQITATNATAFTIAVNNAYTGAELSIDIINTSGGALGAITWPANFKMSAWTSPATANRRTIQLVYDGTNWHQVSVTAADIPN